MRKVVDMFAANSPAPMATVSSASRCMSRSRAPSAALSAALMDGTRVAPPIIRALHSSAFPVYVSTSYRLTPLKVVQLSVSTHGLTLVHFFSLA